MSCDCRLPHWWCFHDPLNFHNCKWLCSVQWVIVIAHITAPRSWGRLTSLPATGALSWGVICILGYQWLYSQRLWTGTRTALGRSAGYRLGVYSCSPAPNKGKLPDPANALLSDWERQDACYTVQKLQNVLDTRTGDGNGSWVRCKDGL